MDRTYDNWKAAKTSYGATSLLNLKALITRIPLVSDEYEPETQVTSPWLLSPLASRRLCIRT